MVSPDEEEARVRKEQAALAVSLAMQGEWKKAIEVNRSILEKYPLDVEAYNRLGRALIELGEYAGAREAYGQALEIAPHNPIAKKNLKRLAHLGEHPHALRGNHHTFTPEIFVKESGKAGVVRLEELASASVLSELTAGEEVYLRVEDNKLLFFDEAGDRIGRAEPKHEARLVRLMEGGNQYTAALRSLGEDEVEVIIRETYQDPSQAGHPSFMPEGNAAVSVSTVRGVVRYEGEEELDTDEDEVKEPKEDRMEDLGFHEISSGG